MRGSFFQAGEPWELSASSGPVIGVIFQLLWRRNLYATPQFSLALASGSAGWPVEQLGGLHLGNPLRIQKVDVDGVAEHAS